MTVQQLINILIETDMPLSVSSLIEASVNLPPRGHRWVATFRDETGQQVWRTTRLTNRQAAMALAQEWEAQARRKRAAQGPLPKKPTLRVRPGSAERELGCLSQREVAAFLRISERAVRDIERRALEKLRRHPALRTFWRQWLSGEVDEGSRAEPWGLTPGEMRALFALTRNTSERQALGKLVSVVWRYQEQFGDDAA